MFGAVHIVLHVQMITCVAQASQTYGPIYRLQHNLKCHHFKNAFL